MKKTIALTWGGSGWHIIPLVSLHNYIKNDEEYEFLWIGEEWNLEEEIADENDIFFLDIAAGKIRRYFDLRNFYEPLKNLTWICQWIYYILKYKIDIVFSKGWFVSFPLCIAAKILGKDIYIHESDVVGGLANKMIAKLATKVFYTFKNDEYASKEKYIHTGQIVNEKLLLSLWNADVPNNPRLRVLVIAWSQWSTTIFENLIPILPDLKHVDFDIILWDKNLHFKEKLNNFTNTKVYNFVDQTRLGMLYKNCDIAITRAWATALWELYYFGIHSIIIPITQAWGHQIYNAEYFKKHVGSDILDENENLSLEMFRKLKKYSFLRKKGLNLEWFMDPLKKIEKEIT